MYSICTVPYDQTIENDAVHAITATDYWAPFTSPMHAELDVDLHA